MGLHLSQLDEADELLTSDPLARLIGMVLDQHGRQAWSEGLPAGSRFRWASPQASDLDPV